MADKKAIRLEITGIETWKKNEFNDGGFDIRWAGDNGFGGLTFYMKDGKIICGNECSSRGFVRQILEKMVSVSEFEDDAPEESKYVIVEDEKDVTFNLSKILKDYIVHARGGG